MVALAARNIESYLAKPDFKYLVYLFYGPDSGLVNERATQLSEKTGIDLKDPFSLLKLTADDATQEAGRLVDEANTINMFGGKRLIRISGNTRRDLMKSLKPVLDAPPSDAMIIIEAGDLKKSASLRRNLEANPQSLCIPCYQDTAAALEMLIDQEIVSKGLKIDNDTRAELRSMLGDNRQLSRNELKKLALYCEGGSTVTSEDITSIVGDGSSLVLNDVVDATAIGNTSKLQSILPKAMASGTSPDMVLFAVLRHFQMLQHMRSKMEASRQPAASLISAARPPIHFSRKNSITTALAVWPVSRISKALIRLDTMILECRKNASAANSIAGTTLLAIALEAQVLGRR